jgi:Holliday junction resolvase RusA-like endonuclease
MNIYIDYDFPNWNEYINKERTNKFAGARIKRQDLDVIRYSTIGMKYKGTYPIRITFKKYFGDKRQDLDNVRIKGIIDGLVKCGIIENDNLNNIQEIILKPIFDNSKEGIEIEIEAI